MDNQCSLGRFWFCCCSQGRGKGKEKILVSGLLRGTGTTPRQNASGVIGLGEIVVVELLDYAVSSSMH